QMIRENAHQGEFAVFDADNTIWFQDLEENLLSYLEMKGILTKQTMDPTLRIVPMHPDDTLLSYGFRLYALDHKIGYPWFGKIFSGFTLAQLKQYVDELFALNGKAITNRCWEDGSRRTYVSYAPRIYPAQRELINTLTENGIEVYVITAALEELVRMVVSDPAYGINIKPENVIGLSCLLKNRDTLEVTTARKQISEGYFWDDVFSKPDHYALEMTSHIWGQDTSYEGKVAALREYIHPLKQPVLAAGDSPSDHSLLLSTDTSKAGVKIWVNHNEPDTDLTKEAFRKRAREEEGLHLAVTGDKNWVILRPDELGICPAPS
ncbi:MAG: haloacid dehalogenase-like hydrolase, partial [Desulfobacterales bacterium]|nr:haloacid dehalogenase-like hydrolase [Desulfobacterales bacterium]